MQIYKKKGKPISSRIMPNLSLSLIFLLLTITVGAKETLWKEPNSALIKIGDNQKTPLILIHGIHGTKKCVDRVANNGSWNNFIQAFQNAANTDLRDKYELYIFQYCSDKVYIHPTIYNELGRSIDNAIADRPPVILAHSMGGLVAKAYMVYYRHGKGAWQNQMGGDTTLGLITLATPHHGTPGANDFKILEPYTKWGWENKVQFSQWYYWDESASTDATHTPTSSEPSRSELRWDNFDNSFDKEPPFNDDNLWLSDANKKIARFYNKIIVYAGFLEVNDDRAWNVLRNNHEKLEIANNIMFKGFGGRFGITDGLVPLKSGLLCTANSIITSTGSNAFCDSKVRMRRFEPGNQGEVAKKDLPYQTISITRKQKRGYDHEDMLGHTDVLEKVMVDLRALLPSMAAVPAIPTLFLFDVSSSMEENNKIEYARTAALRALSELKENRRLGRDNSTVAIWAFSGECQPNTARQILPFTTNLAQVENAMRLQIPKPLGGTPLPQAVDKAIAQVSDYLKANPQIGEGRVILLSDGQSTCGEIRPAGIYSQAKVIKISNIRFLTIGYDIQAGSQAERDLQYLASSSGGRYFPAGNNQQLSRAFEKAIRVYLPKTATGASADFERGVQAILNRDFADAIRIFTIYVQANPNDPLGYYNLALACEAAEFYKRAAEHYKKYLSIAPESVDAEEVRSRIGKIEEDYRDKLFYFGNLLRSDLDYLKAYYQRLFSGQKNAELAAEFAGFVDEKRAFYANLPEILEIKAFWLKRGSEELTDSLGRLYSRVNLSSFDRDAVSLLTLPIGQLEQLVDKLDEYNSQTFK